MNINCHSMRERASGFAIGPVVQLQKTGLIALAKASPQCHHAWMHGYMVRTTLDYEIGGAPVWTYYAVLADTPEQAIESVRERTGKDRVMEVVAGKLLPETIKRLGLEDRQARQL